MPSARMSAVLHNVRTLAAADGAASLADRELLERFAAAPDEVAFAALVRRHGRMVLNLCRRVLHNEADAEDAFQATFLVLSRKAGSLRPQQSLAGWLYRVGYRVAQKARVAAARRRKHEARPSGRQSSDPLAELTLREAHEILDRELIRLPDKLRVPLVLCYLEGLTRDEAAQQLGLPASTLKSRLEQGRERLGQRLASRGLAFGGALTASLFLDGPAAGAVPSVLLDATARAAAFVAAGGAAAAVVPAGAASLTEGVLTTMFSTRLKIACAALLVAALVPFGAGFADKGVAAGEKEAKPAEAAKAKTKADIDLEALLKKATVNGKYQMLLAQIKVEDAPEKKDVDFLDMGKQNGTTFGNLKDVPKGHWVYARPYLFVWRDIKAVAAARPKRAWGPEQATGEPDTNMAGDIQTAWASQSQDDQDEWLMPEYAEPVVPAAVLIHETYNPGALVRVTAFKLDGTEVELWKGQDPTAPDNDMGVSEIPVKVDFKTNRLKVYLASRDVPGWNEIDAIGIRDKGGKVHWATAVEASSTYAPPFDVLSRPAPAAPPNPYEAQIRALQREVAELKAMVEELKKKVDKKEK